MRKTTAKLKVTALCAFAGFLVGCDVELFSSDSDSGNDSEFSGEGNSVVDNVVDRVSGANQRVAAPGSGPMGLPSGTQWIFGTDISGWPENFKMNGVTIHPAANGVTHHVTLDYSGLQEIPAWNVPGDPQNVHNVNGSAWVAREFNGQWYMGTFEYLRVGQQYKEIAASASWQFVPQSGDVVGFMVSTVHRPPNLGGTRSGGQVYQERSDIFWTVWP